MNWQEGGTQGFTPEDADLEEKEYWTDVRDAFKKVRDFCKNLEGCRGCPLRKDEGFHQCVIPASWEILEEEEEEEEEDSRLTEEQVLENWENGYFSNKEEYKDGDD